jgi:hypothetical protein
MLGQWWSGAAGGLWGGLLGVGAAACLRRQSWLPVARWAGALLLLAGGFFLFVLATGFAAAVLGFYRSAVPLSISPSHFVAPQFAIVCWIRSATGVRGCGPVTVDAGGDPICGSDGGLSSRGAGG